MPKTRLKSWKEIGSFFGRSVSTVKRWECERGMPVHRLPGSSHSSIFAEVSELEDWLNSHNGEAAITTGLTEPGFSALRHLRPWQVALAAGLGLAALIAVVVLPGLLRPNPDAPPPEARNLYLQGMKDWQLRRPDSMIRAADEFNAAIRIYPSYARAYAGLANCYNLMPEYTAMPVGQAYPLAKAAAEHAIRLDDKIAAAHAALAFADFFGFWDSVSARREYTRALQLDPDDANVEHWFATFLMSTGDYKGAMVHIDHALALNPDSISVQADRGIIQYFSEPEAAIKTELALEAAYPSFRSPHKYLSDIYFMEGDDVGFIREARITAQLMGDAAGVALADTEEVGLRNGGHEGMLRALLALRLDQFKHGTASAYGIATLYGLLGDKSNALSYLKLSFDRREPDAINVTNDRSFTAIRDTQAFRDQVARLPLGEL